MRVLLVLLLRPPAPGAVDPDRLGAALRIYGADLGVEVRVEDAPPAPGARAQEQESEARRKGRARGASFAVWYAPQGADLALYVLDLRGATRLRTLRVPVDAGAEAYRTMALKIRGELAAPPPPAVTAAASPPSQPAAVPPAASRARPSAEIGYTVSALGDVPAQHGLALGAALPVGPVEAGAALAAFDEVERSSGAGVVAVRDLAVGAVARWMPLRRPWLEAGVHAGFRAHAMRARGEAPDGDVGDVVFALPAVRGGPDLRVPLGRSAWLRLAPQVEWMGRRRVTVRDQEALHVGGLRGGGELTLAVALR